MKQQQKDVFMSLFTAIGGILGIIIYFICTYLLKNYQTIGALSIFVLAILFRVIGHTMDNILSQRKR